MSTGFRLRALQAEPVWLEVVRQAATNLARWSAATVVSFWVPLPDGSRWMRIQGIPQLPGDTSLPGPVEPLDAVRKTRHPLRVQASHTTVTYQGFLRRVGVEEAWLLPLSAPGRRPVGVLSLGYPPAGAPSSPPPVGHELPIIGYLVAQRLEQVLLDEGVAWAEALIPPETPEEWELVLASIRGWLGGDHWVLQEVGTSGPRWVAECGTSPGWGLAWTRILEHSPESWLACPAYRCLAQGRIVWVEEVDKEPPALQEAVRAFSWHSLVSIPIQATATHPPWVASVYWREPGGWELGLPSVSPWEALHRYMNLWRQRSTLTHQATRDPLTGCYNRRGAMARWQKRASAGGVFVVLDVDHFAEVNNRWGHSTGDSVLRTLGHALQEEVSQAGGWVTRWGGDEFVLVLPADTDLGTFSRRLQARLDQQARTEGWLTPVTVSAGAVRWEGSPPAWEDLFSAADASLYEAKAQGRNRWETRPFPPAPQG